MKKGFLQVLRGQLALIAALAGLATLAAAPATAQDADEDAAAAAAIPSGWTLDPYARAELGVLDGKTRTDDGEFSLNGSGLLMRGTLGVDLERGSTTVRLEADHLAIDRFSSTRRNMDRDRLTVSVAQQVSPAWELELRARRYDDLEGAEASDIDANELTAQVTFQPERAHRFRLQGTWNDRQYDDGSGPGGSGSHGHGPELGAEYRHRLGRNQYLTIAARAEAIDSANPVRRYSRQVASVAYTQPMARDWRLRPAVQLRHTRFGGRPVGTGVREDTYLAPEVQLQWSPGKWRVEAEARYTVTSSTDPVRDRDGYRVGLTIARLF